MKQPCEKSWQFNKPVEEFKHKEVSIFAWIFWAGLLLSSIILFATQHILIGYTFLFLLILVTIKIMQERHR